MADTNSAPRPTPRALLSELLALHETERGHMRALRHEEHQRCVEEKLRVALAIEAELARGGALGAAELDLLRSVKKAAEANVAIAEKMLTRVKGKIDLIHRLSAPSYGSDGKMSQRGGSGGLLDLKA